MTKNDVILYSFPKSGNTWVRFLLANYFNQNDKLVDEVDFHNIHELMPSLEEKRKSLFNMDCQILKTHSNYISGFTKVAMIIRNPYDTLWSYFHFLNKEKSDNVTMENLIYDSSRGIKAIVEGCNSYLASDCKIFVMNYEQLMNNPYPTLIGLLDFVGYEVNLGNLEKAYKLSSFEQMRNVEERKGRKFGDSSFKFTRSGNIGESQTFFNEKSEHKQFIKKELRNSYLLDLMYRDY